MGKSNRKGKKKSKGKRPDAPPWSAADEAAHYAALGCHVAHLLLPSPAPGGAPWQDMRRRALRRHPWLLGIDPFDPADYDPGDVARIPEVALDDGDGCGGRGNLTLTNVAGDATNVCFVTVYDVDLCDAKGSALTSGTASIREMAVEDGTSIVRERKCTTFIVLCPPQTFVHLCSLAPRQRKSSAGRDNPITSWSQVEIESDVQPWSSHPNTDDEYPYLLHFPFEGVDEETSEGASAAYQCIQSEHGQLTHCE